MPDFFLYFPVFIFGLAAGSFLNCLIYRLEIGDKFPTGRSYCPRCKHILSWQDLIPLLSFFLLKGKCRYCHQKISRQYPLVEFAAGTIFVLISSLMTISNLSTGVYLLLISCFLIVIFVYDLKHYIIPDKIIYSAIITSFIYNIYYSLFIIRNSELIIQSLLAAIGASALFLFIFLASRGEWLGFGDVKLAFFMGLLLGWPNVLVAMFLGFMIGAIIGLGLIILGRKTLKSEVPFGPFLVSGTFIALFFGEELVRHYLLLFI